jgi:hypothetical protein
VKRPNILQREIAVEVIIHAPSKALADECLEDIRREVQRVAGRQVLQKRYNVELHTGEAYVS